LLWLSVALSLSWSAAARAELIIKNDAGSPEFAVEVEPHAVLAPFWPPGGSGQGLGLGLLVGINLAPRGFIPTVNDSVSLGLGLDWVSYFGSQAQTGDCTEWRGSGQDAICVRTSSGGGTGNTYFYSPVVMQWNFYLTDQWSVFGEPGLALYLNTGGIDGGARFGLTPVFNAGGKWHFSKAAALTMRLGYPYTTVGVSLYF
jgi:hypothetical protein